MPLPHSDCQVQFWKYYLLFWLTPGIALVDVNITARAPIEPSYEYFDYSTVQIWLGLSQRTVGWITGSELYHVVYSLLKQGCPDNSANSRYGGVCAVDPNLTFNTKCITNPPDGIGDCMFNSNLTYSSYFKLRR